MKCILCFANLSLIINLIKADCSNYHPCQLKGGKPYTKPDVVESVNGRLNFTLSIEITNLTFEWLSLFRRTYNGSIPGLTWRIRAGDEVKVTLINTLQRTDEPLPPMNNFRYPNVSNLHTHGLHISSKSPGDNIFTEVDPGNNYTYQFNIAKEQPAGICYFHAHMHGSVMFQVEGGLAGFIIIEDPTTGPFAMPSHLAEISCPDNCDHEVPLFFHPTLRYASQLFNYYRLQTLFNDSMAFRNTEMTSENITVGEWLSDPENGINHYTTNGLLFPVINFTTGQRKRFRMANGAGLAILELLITDQNGTTPSDACEVWEIALDGIYLDEARKPRLNKTFLSPAERAEWIVACSKPGIYELKSYSDPYENCSIGRPLDDRYKGILLTMNITGDPVTLPPQDRTLPRRPSFLRDFRKEPVENISNRKFTVEMSPNQNFNRDVFSTPDYFRYKVELNKVNQWYVTNSDPTSSHPLHIHVNSFQVISYNDYHGPVGVLLDDPKGRSNVYYSQDGQRCKYQSAAYKTGEKAKFHGLKWVTDPAENPCPEWNVINHRKFFARGGPGTLGYATLGDFHDTLLIPPLANITIRFMTHQFLGTMVLHCHFFMHEDIGMMMVVDVVEEGASLVANETSGNAMPGQCFDPPPIEPCKEGDCPFSIEYFILLLLVAATTLGNQPLSKYLLFSMLSC